MRPREKRSIASACTRPALRFQLSMLTISSEIDHSMFVLTVDLWNEAGTQEVNLVRSSAGTPSISSTTTYSYTALNASFNGSNDSNAVQYHPPTPLIVIQNMPNLRGSRTCRIMLLRHLAMPKVRPSNSTQDDALTNPTSAYLVVLSERLVWASCAVLPVTPIPT